MTTSDSITARIFAKADKELKEYLDKQFDVVIRTVPSELLFNTHFLPNEGKDVMNCYAVFNELKIRSFEKLCQEWRTRALTSFLADFEALQDKMEELTS